MVAGRAESQLPKLIRFPSVQDARGSLTYFEVNRQIPFPIRRVYYIHDIPENASRGFHAHRALERVVVAMSGAVRVVLDDGKNRAEHLLASPAAGLHVGPGLWIELHDFRPGTVCCMFASDYYDESDYIRNYEEFLRWTGEN